MTACNIITSIDRIVKAGESCGVDEPPLSDVVVAVEDSEEGAMNSEGMIVIEKSTVAEFPLISMKVALYI